MTDRKPPTPITSRLKPPVDFPGERGPEPIVLPAPTTFDERIRTLVRSTVAKQLYHVLRSKEEIDIITMSESEFEEFCERVLAEEDEGE